MLINFSCIILIALKKDLPKWNKIKAPINSPIISWDGILWRIVDNNVATDVKSSGRGEFNNAAFKSSGKKGKSLWQSIKKHKTVAYVTAGALGIAGLGYAGYKSGWLSPKFEEETKNGNLSCVG